MWIMIIEKLPTNPSPPRLSIFWSVPWPDPDYQKRLEEVLAGEALAYQHGLGDDLVGIHHKRRGRILEDSSRLLSINSEFDRQVGKRSPNWIGARRITYLEENIRVFPHEFTEQPVTNMREFILSEFPSHELVASDVSGEMMMRDIRSGARRVIYDAALIDGCTHAQALATAWGKDVTIPDADFPLVGWYRCVEAYAALFAQ